MYTIEVIAGTLPMHYNDARQVKWDLVDYLLCNYTESSLFYEDYDEEKREYAQHLIRRIAANLNVKDHIYL
jgi:hypothetical protein